MIVPEPGVLVPAGRLAGVAAQAFGEYVRRHQVRDLDVLRLAHEFSAAAEQVAEVADAAASSVTSEPEGVTIGTYAELTGIPVRTLRRHAATGRVPAEKRDDGTWVITETSSSPR